MGEIRFNLPIVQVPAEELRGVFNDFLDYDASGAATAGFVEVTRAIILNEVDFPSDTAVGDLRDIWYASVKLCSNRNDFK